MQPSVECSWRWLKNINQSITWDSDEAIQALADQLIDNVEASAPQMPANVVAA